jgi:DNA-binding NarL/FixJ family response regulator
MNEQPKILVVDDEALIAEDVADLCRLNGYEVCGTAFTAGQALLAIDRERPTLVLLDINLNGDMDGVEIAEHLRSKYTIPFIFLTSYVDANTLARAKATLPLGYIVKPFNAKQLYSSIEIAWAQYAQRRTPELDLEKLNRRLLSPLSQREEEVLACIYKGLDTKGTAQAMYVSVNTVKYHLKNLYEKLDAHNRAELLYRLKQMMEA